MTFLSSNIKATFVLPKESLGKSILGLLKTKNFNDVFQVDVTTEESLTWGNLMEESIKFLQVLKKLGVQRNDVITIISQNNLKFPIFLLGAFYNGVVVNALNPDYFVGELKHGLSIAKPKLIICSKSVVENVQLSTAEFDFVETILTVGLDCEAKTELRSIEELLKDETADVYNFVPEEFDYTQQDAVILLSSGTTGLPKGVVLTHSNLRESSICLNDKNQFDVSCATTIQVVPNFHIFGVVLQIVSMTSSMKIILMKKFIPNLYLSTIEKYKATKLFAVPSLLLFIVKSPLAANYDLSSVTEILVGAAPVSPEIQSEAKQKFPNIFIREFYGATELSGAVTIQTAKYNKPGSSGVLLANATAKVSKVDNKEQLAKPFELGELCFKGPKVMKGYIDNPVATCESFDDDGFYHTGDLGYYDDDHFFYVVDRIKELIKYKGFQTNKMFFGNEGEEMHFPKNTSLTLLYLGMWTRNNKFAFLYIVMNYLHNTDQVSPAEMEALILSHPGVKDCGVIGIPDTRSGEIPMAFVVKQQNTEVSEDELVQFVAERISIQKRLYGGVRFIDEIPRNPSGKILRKKIVELYKTISLA